MAGRQLMGPLAVVEGEISYFISGQLGEECLAGNRIVSKPFEYSPLPSVDADADFPGSKHIRLLHIQPGRRGQDVECELAVVRLDEVIDQYEALSYVWDDEPKRTRVQVNGNTMDIGLGLWRGLYNLRRDKSVRTLWVDAICINQANNTEKAGQLMIMGEIYRNAAQTIIWLGESDAAPNVTSSAMRFVRGLAAESEAVKRGRGTVGFTEEQSLESPVRRARRDTQLRYIMEHDWWGRVWTVQEILLAKSATIVQGRLDLSWADFCSGLRYGIKIGIWKDAEVFLGGLLTVDDFACPIQPFKWLDAMQQPPSFNNPADKLLFYLSRTQNRASTKPQDRIFSLLGMLTPNEILHLGIRPDYTSPIAHVYRTAAQRMIQVSCNLDILGFAGLRRSHPESAVPSWAPDWRNNVSHNRASMMEDSRRRPCTTHASRGSAAEVEWEDDGKILVLQGHVFGIIDRLSVKEPIMPSKALENPFAFDEGDGLEKLLTCAREVTRIAAQSRVGPYFEWEAFIHDLHPTNRSIGGVQSPEPDPMLVYCLTLCTGTLAPGGVSETRGLFEHWRRKLGMDKAGRGKRPTDWGLRDGARFLKRNWREYSPFYEYMIHAADKTLGATRERMLCLLPESTAVGDYVVVVRGGRVPLVLRPAEKGYFKLIGETYVHGIMDGEAFDGKACQKFRVL